MDKLKLGFKSAIGRNRGRISSYHRETGVKKKYIRLDFSRILLDIKGKIKVIKKDLYRTGFIMGISFTNGIFAYMLAVDGLKIGDFIQTKQDGLLRIGDACSLKFVKIGVKIHNLEFFPGTGGKISRSAGTFSKIIKKYTNNALVKLTSGEFRLFFLTCMCTIGRVSNSTHMDLRIEKAGVNRKNGWRPIVRGRAMNPVDHPHGGRTNGGITPRTPWGALTRGVKTRVKINNYIIKRRKK